MPLPPKTLTPKDAAMGETPVRHALEICTRERLLLKVHYAGRSLSDCTVFTVSSSFSSFNCIGSTNEPY